MNKKHLEIWFDPFRKLKFTFAFKDISIYIFLIQQKVRASKMLNQPFKYNIIIFIYMYSEEKISSQPLSSEGRASNSLKYEIKAEVYNLEPAYDMKNGSQKEGSKEKPETYIKKNERLAVELLPPNQKYFDSGVDMLARERRIAEMMKNKKVSPEGQKLLQRLQRLKRQMEIQNEMSLNDEAPQKQDEDSLMNFRQQIALGRKKQKDETKIIGGILPQNSSRQSANESEKSLKGQNELELENPVKKSEYYNSNKKLSEFQMEKQALIIQNQRILRQEKQRRQKAEEKNEELLMQLNNLVRQNQALKEQLKSQKQEKGYQKDRNPNESSLKDLANDPATIRVNSNSTDQSNIEEGPAQKLLNRLQQLKLLLKQKSSKQNQTDQKTTYR